MDRFHLFSFLQKLPYCIQKLGQGPVQNEISIGFILEIFFVVVLCWNVCFLTVFFFFQLATLFGIRFPWFSSANWQKIDAQIVNSANLIELNAVLQIIN